MEQNSKYFFTRARCIWYKKHNFWDKPLVDILERWFKAEAFASSIGFKISKSFSSQLWCRDATFQLCIPTRDIDYTIKGIGRVRLKKGGNSTIGIGDCSYELYIDVLFQRYFWVKQKYKGNDSWWEVCKTPVISFGEVKDIKYEPVNYPGCTAYLSKIVQDYAMINKRRERVLIKSIRRTLTEESKSGMYFIFRGILQGILDKEPWHKIILPLARIKKDNR